MLVENNLEEHLAQAVKVTGYNLSLQQYSVGGAPIDAFKGRYRLLFRGTQSQNRIAALLGHGRRKNKFFTLIQGRTPLKLTNPIIIS